MSSVYGFRGVYAVDWARTAPGDEWGLPPEAMSVGQSWSWRGEPVRLDGGLAALWLSSTQMRCETRARARSRMRRLAPAPAPALRANPECDETVPAGEGWFEVTDGIRRYSARILRRGAGYLAVFWPFLPPPGRGMWISALSPLAHARRRDGVICFLPGTRIETPEGARPVETLQPGDLITTQDNGARPLIWRGETRLSGAELTLAPELRPIALRGGELLVSPGHRVVMLNAGAEVLVGADALLGCAMARRDGALTSVRYIHLMLERHEILFANGIACESFHPGLAGPGVLAWHARSLERARPGVIGDPWALGDTARRCLSSGEAAILSRDLAWPKTTRSGTAGRSEGSLTRLATAV